MLDGAFKSALERAPSSEAAYLLLSDRENE
jgi:hypothetical protein